jgi:predicted transcriptional regulator
MTPRPVADEGREAFHRLHDLRSAALEHARLAREPSSRRRAVIAEQPDAGYSQSDIARETGVTRQAVQKMLAAG